jgi:hypothetical protein
MNFFKHSAFSAGCQGQIAFQSTTGLILNLLLTTTSRFFSSACTFLEDGSYDLQGIPSIAWQEGNA